MLNLQSNRLSWGNMVLVEKGRIGADRIEIFNLSTLEVSYQTRALFLIKILKKCPVHVITRIYLGGNDVF